MADKKVCEQCGDVLKDQDAKRCPDIHPCDLRALDRVRAEVKKLKASVDAWKNAWFNGREIIGNLWWHHPAITDDKQREYCQSMIKKCVNHSCGSCNDCENYMNDTYEQSQRELNG